MSSDKTEGTAQRVAASQEKGIAVQKKTFTRWVNMYLERKGSDAVLIEDLFEDTKQCVRWCELLEIIGAQTFKEVIGHKYNANCKFPVHAQENAHSVFEYCKKKGCEFVNVGGTDLLAGNPKLILGFVWKIIMTFSIDEGQEGILLWAQRSIKKYNGVEIKDFSKSFKDGIAFCALIHRYHPELIAHPSTFTTSNAGENLELAFSIANDKLGIKRLIDVDDIVSNERPDEKSIATYISQWYSLFAKEEANIHYVQSIFTAVAVTRRHDELITKYDQSASTLKVWIETEIEKLVNKQNSIPTSTSGVENMLSDLYKYRQIEKPVKQREVMECEGILGSLSSSSKANNRPKYKGENSIDPPSLHTLFTTLESREKELETVLRTKVASYRQVDFLVTKFQALGHQLETWIKGRQTEIETEREDNYGEGVHGAQMCLFTSSIYNDQLLKYKDTYQECASIVEKLQHEAFVGHTSLSTIDNHYSTLTSLLSTLEEEAEVHTSNITSKIENEKKNGDFIKYSD
jgi:spectrin beta